jgi:hypothetical protein
MVSQILNIAGKLKYQQLLLPVASNWGNDKPKSNSSKKMIQACPGPTK